MSSARRRDYLKLPIVCTGNICTNRSALKHGGGRSPNTSLITTNYAFRSSAKSLPFVPKVNCSTLGDRSFARAAPVLMELAAIDYKNK